jgi:hypothetical protein
MEKHVKLQKYIKHTSFAQEACCFPYEYRNEREKYAKHKRKAEKQPAGYTSIIIDGMDQDKTNIPHILSNPKVRCFVN